MVAAILFAFVAWPLCQSLADKVSWTTLDYTFVATVEDRSALPAVGPELEAAMEGFRSVECSATPDALSPVSGIPMEGKTLVTCRFIIPDEPSQVGVAMLEKARAYAFHRYLAFPAAGEDEWQAYQSAMAGVIAHTGIAIEGLHFLLTLVLGLLAALVSGWRVTAVGGREGRPGFLAARSWIAVLVVTPWLVTLLWFMALVAIHGPWMPSLLRGLTMTEALWAFVAAPLAEEVFWRRWLTTALDHHLPTWLALVVPAAMFTLSHDVDSPRALIQMFLVSLALGLLWLRSRSVLLCAVSHAGVNVIITALNPQIP